MNYGRLDDDRFLFARKGIKKKNPVWTNVFLQNLQKSALVFLEKPGQVWRKSYPDRFTCVLDI